MKHLLIILVSLSLLFSCDNNNSNSLNAFQLVPENTSLVLVANNMESLDNSLKSNGVLQELSKYSQIENFSQARSLASDRAFLRTIINPSFSSFWPDSARTSPERDTGARARRNPRPILPLRRFLWRSASDMPQW